jgi:chaperone modulatory protein CbpM
MPKVYSEEETVATVARLTRRRLSAFVSAEAVTPAAGDRGPCYTRVDIARLELLCDLTDGFELDDDALGLVVSLVDRLHAARADLAALAAAIADEPAETRRRLAAALSRSRR